MKTGLLNVVRPVYLAWWREVTREMRYFFVIGRQTGVKASKTGS